MQVRDRYGQIRVVPEALGRLMVQRGAVTAVEVAPKPKPKPEPETSKAKKSKKAA